MYIGKRIDGRYEIDKLIGVGGMANVYRAKDLLQDRTVAVKILRDEFLNNEDLVRRFKNESKAISLLNHPNIIKVFDVSVSDKIRYIAMEYVDGITLKDYIEEQKVLSWRETVFFIEQILSALGHAHEKGIIHRDVKPQNIMVLDKGSIKVMDFGIARFSRSETHTVTDKAIGSVHYISPEQAKGDRIDAKADIYSTGVIMYEMLTGKLPFDSESAVQVAIKQISDAPTPPRLINGEIPEPLEEITMRAMAKNPLKRYKDTAEMFGAIEEFKHNPSIKFEYEYLDDSSPTRYIDKVVNNAKNSGPKKKKTKFKLTVPVLAGVASAFAVGSLILCLLIFNASGYFKSSADIELENFVGKTINDVRDNADYQKNYNFKYEEIHSAEYAEGEIYSQKPKPPKMVKEGAKITLYVSKGKEIIKIPDVAGKIRGDAEKILSRLGLSVLVIPEKNDVVEPGTVIRTNPVPGEKLETGGEITLYVSIAAGQDLVVVPDLVGIATAAEARKILETNRLIMATPVTIESLLPAGTVVEQIPAALTEAPVGSRVTVKISSGVVTPPEPEEKTVKISVSFDANAKSSQWTAVLDGVNVSTFSSSPSSVWNFEIKGKVESTLVVTNGITTQSVTIDYQNVPAYSLAIQGAKPTPPPPKPTPPPPKPTPAPPVPTPSPTPPVDPSPTAPAKSGKNI